MRAIMFIKSITVHLKIKTNQQNNDQKQKSQKKNLFQ